MSDRDALPEHWQRGFAWLERELGGKLTRWESQDRWRPAWFLELDCDGERRGVYFRGDRGTGQGGVYGLEHECDVLRVLEAHGIPVPHVYGFCDDPRGIVMERSPGRANLATADDARQREAVLDHYIEILVEMHRIDPAAFETQGLRRPETPAELGLADLPLWEKSFRQQKSRPEPLVEFVLGWLKRNVPTHRTRAGFVAGDSGQFLFQGDRVTAVLDLELAFLGDPLADLGAMRSRDVSEPLGDLSRAFRRYASLSGEALDLPVLHYHTVRFALNTPLAVAPLCARPPPGLNFAQYLGWNLVYGRLPLEVIAEVEGVELEAPEPPEPGVSAHAAAHDAIVGMLESAAEGSYEVDTALRVAQYLREVDRRGPRLAEQDLEEAAHLLDARPRSRAEADAALEERIETTPPGNLTELVQYLYRRTLRDEALLRPALRELTDVEFQPIRV